MTPKKKEPGKNFTSFRIIGEKAHKLLTRAKKIKDEQEPAKGAVEFPEGQQYPEVMVHLSIPSIVKATLAVAGVAFCIFLVYQLQSIIVLFFLSLFLATIMDPGVQALQRLRFPRGLAVLLHYLAFLLLAGFLFLSLVPVMAVQIVSLARLVSDQVNIFLLHPHITVPLFSDNVNQSLTNFAETTLRDLSINQFTDAMQEFGQNLQTTTQTSIVLAAHLAGSVVNFFINLIIILVAAFFMQIDKEKIFAWLRGFLPTRYRAYMDDKSEAIQWKLAQWARGQLLLCLCMGVIVFLALEVLGMPYALILAIFAAFTEFIPAIGPLIAGVPTVLIALAQQGLMWGLVIVALYYVIQWCENNLLSPLIMKRAVGLSPVAIMFSMLIGISFPSVIHPMLGVIIAIPTSTIISLFIDDWRNYRLRQRAMETK